MMRLFTLPVRMKLLAAAVVLFMAQPIQAQKTDLGTTSFDNSGSEEAQDAFLRGLLLLHSFEYSDAREAFVEAQTIDPEFAMAYWGEAMTRNQPLWYGQDLDSAREALERLAPDLEKRLAKAPTERERAYLNAVNTLFYGEEEKLARDIAYMQVMERLAADYPDDLDASAFYALSILGTAHDGRDFATYMRAAAVAEEVFAKNPDHPGAAHYLIHSYDDAVHAPLGLRAAFAYSQIAPAASHALHMPSHIFVSMGMWDHVTESNDASFKASDERMQRKGLDVNARSFHARHWHAYGLLQQGRFKEARGLLDDMAQDVIDGEASTYARSHLSLMRAMYMVETQGIDQDAATWEIDMTDLSNESTGANLYITGLTALEMGDDDAASRNVKAMMDIKGRDEEAVRIMQHQLKSALLRHEGNVDEALKLLVKAADMENAMPMIYGPPVPIKPSNELLGEYYLASGEYSSAQNAFEAALARAPKRVLSLAGLAKAASKAGNQGVADSALATLREIRRDADADVNDWASD